MRYFDVVGNRRACLWRDLNLAETTRNTNRKWKSDLLGAYCNRM